MAEIPVEREEKSGLPWWLIPLILLLVLIPLLWFMMRGCDTATPVAVDDDNNNRAVATETNTVLDDNDNDKGEVVGARITDVNAFGDADDKLSLDKRGVDLKEVKVKRLLSDRAFTVASGNDEMYVVLDKTLDKMIDNKAGGQVQPGDMIKISGDFRRVPENESDLDTGLKADEFKNMQANKIYLHADNLASVDMGDKADGDRITDVTIFGSTADRLTLVKKEADFTAVKVKRLLSDRVFTVVSGDKEMFVLLDESLDMKVDNKPLRQVKPGEMLKISGDFRRVPDSPKDEMNTGLKEGEYKQMMENQVYLHAHDLPNKLK